MGYRNAPLFVVAGHCCCLLCFQKTLVTKIPADKTKDMLRLLSREDDRLRVGMEQVALSVVKKVALSEYKRQIRDVVVSVYGGKSAQTTCFRLSK